MQTQTKNTWLELPQKLTRENRWVLWRLASASQNGFRRPPIELYQAKTPDQAADVADPYTWASFDRAHDAVQRGLGRGLAYINSRYAPIVTITFYNALLEGGKVAFWALRHFDTLNTYAEEGIVPGSLVLIYEGGSEQPLTWGNIAVRRNPFVALTGKHLPGSPTRVGTSPTRLAAFINESRRDYEKLIKQRGGSPKSHLLGKNLERLLSSIEGVRKVGPNHWMAVSPVGTKTETTLSIRLRDGRILLYDYSGASVEEIIKALGIGYGDLLAEKYPPDLPLGSGLPALVRPLEGGMLERVRRSMDRLRSMGKLPRAFEGRGFTYTDAVDAGLGAGNNKDGVVVHCDLEGRPLSAQLLRGEAREGVGSLYSITPGHALTPWLGPGLKQATSGIVVVQGVLNAVLVWSLVRQDGLGVIGLPDLHHDLAMDLLKRLSLQNVYLYAEPHEQRQDILERWAMPLRRQGFPTIPLTELVPGYKTDLAGFVHKHGTQALLERLVEMGVGN